jgi:Zn-dependent protease with chaperone function
MTDLAGHPALLNLANSPSVFLVIPLLPVLITFCFWCYALHVDESDKTSRWIACRRWMQVILLLTVAAWWALWDFQSGPGLIPRPTYSPGGIDPALTKLLLFWGLPIGGFAVVQLICYSLDRAFLGRRWTVIDVCRLAFWRTLCPTVALLFVATGFEAIYDGSLLGVLWLIVAAILAMVGTISLELAGGLKLQQVKSGELYKRAFVLAKEMQTTLKRVYVVPAGRGHLTNAYGLPESIVVTDNYGKFLSRAQLDFVFGHELGHVKARHGRKKLLIVVIVFACIALVCFFLPPALTPFRPLLDILVVFVPILTFYFFSRHFEYAADEAGVELTHDPETAIRALASLYRVTQAPTRCGRLTELFMTHPGFDAPGSGDRYDRPVACRPNIRDHRRDACLRASIGILSIACVTFPPG